MFDWQIFKRVSPTDTYTTIFHVSVLLGVVSDIRSRISMERVESFLDCYVGKTKEQLDKVGHATNQRNAVTDTGHGTVQLYTWNSLFKSIQTCVIVAS